ncbi:unnamed protein product [Moneuplotes crassus]|uniref:UDP-N-acetylglucosamine--peptide N-acetylglucosaminyltransferase SPINDLY n=1 Tax=Euplotes crassus TaxID=5936 RepID=A0AAD1YBC3_EUPCR|nr:unnamed protein product [Moneuplotes crassus]
MEKRKVKKSARKPRNIGIDGGEGMMEPLKVLKKAKAEFNNAKTDKDYSNIIKTLQETSKPDLPDIYALIGQCYIRMGAYDRAVHSFTEAADSAEKEPEHYNWCGYCYQQLNNSDEALAHYTKAIQLGKNNGEYYYNRATVKKEMNNYKEAIEDFELAIKHLETRSSSDSKQQEIIYQAYYSKGICLRQLEMLDESIQDLKKAVDLKPDEPSAHNNLGMSYFKAGDFEDSTIEYSKAINHVKTEHKNYELDPEIMKQIAIFCNNRGLAFYHQHRYAEAKTDFDEAISLEGDDAIYYFNRGNNSYDQSLLLANIEGSEENAKKLYQAAHADYDKAIELKPTDPRFYHSKGLAFEGTNNEEDYDEAIQNFQKATEIDDKFFGAEVHLGNMYHKSNEFLKALKCYRKFLDNYSTHEDVYVSRGLVYQDMGNHQFAIKDFDSAIKINPKCSDAYYHRGVSELKSRRYSKAIEDLTKAIEERTKDNYGIYDALGCCYQAQKDYDLAFRYMDEAISKEPTNIQFLMNRAQCNFELGHDEDPEKQIRHFTASIEDLEAALDIDENDPKVLYKLGLSYYAFGKYKRCIKTLKGALKCVQEITSSGIHTITYESDIFYHIGIAYSNLERFEEAVYPLTKAIELIPSDIRYVHERAKAYQMVEEHSAAIEDFDTVIHKSPNNAHAYFRRAFSHKALKNFEQAADDFETAKRKDPTNQKLVVNYKKLKGITCIVLCRPGDEPVYT